MAKRNLTVCGSFVAVCEEAMYDHPDEGMRKALFHPRLGDMTKIAGYAPYWICGDWTDYKVAKECDQ